MWDVALDDQIYQCEGLRGMIKYTGVGCCMGDQIYQCGMLHGLIKYTGVGCCMG